MAKTPRGAAPAKQVGRGVPTYPLGPTSLEITVAAMVRDGALIPWDGRRFAGDGDHVVEDEGDVDLEQAKSLLLRREISSAGLPPAERVAIVRGSVELTEHALARAHRAVILLVEDEVLPPFLQEGWTSGKIGMPKGSPAVRQVNLHRPGE